MTSERTVAVPPDFSLAQTCGPVAWARGRWPNTDWRAGALIWVGYERGLVVTRVVRQNRGDAASGCLVITGTADPGRDRDWVRRVLAPNQPCPAFADPVIERQRQALSGLKPYAYGSLFEGLVTSIIGQSISVAAAATVQTRIAALFAPGIEIAVRTFWPLPTAAHFAEADPALLRAAGVTTRRAEALVYAGRAASDGHPAFTVSDGADLEVTERALRDLPLVGPWTARSALLWGIGAPDAFPTRDVALLRATRQAYANDGLELKDLDRLAEAWRPARAWATRLLWTSFFGVAPSEIRTP